MILNANDLEKLNKENYDVTVLVSDHTDTDAITTKGYESYVTELTIPQNDFTVFTIEIANNKKLVRVNMSRDISAREAQILAKKLAKELSEAKDIAVVCETVYDPEITTQFLKRFGLSFDRFAKYMKTGISSDHQEITDRNHQPSIHVYGVDKVKVNAINHRIKSVAFAKNLVNEPANVMTPTQLAAEAESFSLNHNIDVTIMSEAKIQSLKMDAFLSVAQGSDEKPKLIVMRYMNNPDSKEIIGLVGKGVTYDSGGLAIKPATGMVTMHADMGGSAAVIGAINLLAVQEAKVNVVAVVAACENMISGHAYRNGDIINSMSGKKIEVINTDAEGRLTLADAIWYAHEIENVTRIVDIATLTGAVYAALGDKITGVVSDDETFYKHLESASEAIGDKIWRLPIDEELAKCNESKRADIKNASTCGAGTTTAGLFLRSFAKKLPWTHLDIAATAYKSESDFDPEGASGVGVELLADAVVKFFSA